MRLANAAEVESAYGQRYRREVTDLRRGVYDHAMIKRLRMWGCEATQNACRDWLRRYRLGDGAKDGGSAMYAISRQDLQRWYHVEGLRGDVLAEK